MGKKRIEKNFSAEKIKEHLAVGQYYVNSASIVYEIKKIDLEKNIMMVEQTNPPTNKPKKRFEIDSFVGMIKNKYLEETDNPMYRLPITMDKSLELTRFWR